MNDEQAQLHKFVNDMPGPRAWTETPTRPDALRSVTPSGIVEITSEVWNQIREIEPLSFDAQIRQACIREAWRVGRGQSGLFYRWFDYERETFVIGFYLRGP